MIQIILLAQISILGPFYIYAQTDEPVAGNYLTGDWGGTRQSMADKGVIMEMVYTADNFYNATGGIKTGYAYLANADLTLDMDMEKLAGWTGGKIFLYGLGGHGQAPTEFTGDAQATSNIETGMNYFKLYEAYIDQTIGKFSLLVGLHDLNSEFYGNDPAGLFLNSSQGIGTDMAQTGENGPSIFPSTALAARAKIQPTETFYIQAAGYNAIAGDPANPEKTYADTTFKNGFLVIGETGLYKEGAMKAAIGVWTYTDKLPALDPTLADQSGYGYYILFDFAVNDNTSLFARAGRANPDAYDVEYNIAEGIVFSGKLWNREDDSLGLGISTIIPSVSSILDQPETAIELTYKIQVTPYFGIQPDFQYVMNPGLTNQLNDALAMSVRADLSF